MTTATNQMVTTQVYRVYIKATPQAIWDAITKSEWTDGMFRLDNFAAVRCHRRNGIIQSAVGVQVDHRALFRRLFFLAGK